MYRVFRNIISQIIWARRILKMRGEREEERKEKNINKVMPRVQERDRE